ncbi:DNA-3-methyladenine glycosylase family protein [Pseudoblastomonas halimionae]|uniref:HhH-GPD domain-containing protein n=1 Tax=Alteriqipengyuania halimionae TaxID=1926630 RepID=A0A6I4U599_9SPHN|nr:hypothetical protein [Alteriqipengyuania halimionae]MXP09611.1 hypothetical protein [Alteriqipengyuania halimionae]
MAYPALLSIFEELGPPEVIKRSSQPLPVSVVKIVVGQMLSGAAAATIYRRLEKLYLEEGIEGPHLLKDKSLRSAGLSTAKTKAIRGFADAHAREPERFEAWKRCSYDELKKDATRLWGLSSWSASILALSHFGMTDVWPSEDGSIQRAVRIIRQSIEPEFQADKAAPYRTYLAKMLWAALDNSLLTDQPRNR